MTQPTQEDLERVAKEILKWFPPGGAHPTLFMNTNGVYAHKSELPNFYIDDSFTGALVKAVFPLLAERGWLIRLWEKDVEIFSPIQGSIISSPNLNTALIEAYFKIEG